MGNRIGEHIILPETCMGFHQRDTFLDVISPGGILFIHTVHAYEFVDKTVRHAGAVRVIRVNIQIPIDKHAVTVIEGSEGFSEPFDLKYSTAFLTRATT